MNKQEKSEADAYTRNMRNGNTDVRKRLYIANDEEADPSSFQRFFLEHPEINVSEFAKGIGMNPSLLRNYINGIKKPSKENKKRSNVVITTFIHFYTTEISNILTSFIITSL